ncbi:MAG: TVP38/TMEM64 family protein [Cyanobacteria bacterium J06560_2]
MDGLIDSLIHGLSTLTPELMADKVLQAGDLGPILYMALIALSVVLSQIPGAPLAVIAGTIWPPLLAGVYTVIGGFSGAIIAYGLGKVLGQPVIKKLTGKQISFSSEHSDRTLGWMVFITRLVPVFSFDLVSYGAGMVGLSLPVYASATLLGMVPSTLLLTFMGDRIQLDPTVILSLAIAFTLLFVAMPYLMYRYNWLNMRMLISWE